MTRGMMAEKEADSRPLEQDGEGEKGEEVGKEKEEKEEEEEEEGGRRGVKARGEAKAEGGRSKGKQETSRRRFTLREELSEVKAILEGTAASDDKCTQLNKKYQLLAKDYKRLEKRLVECQRKQLEVAQHRDIIQNEYARVNLAKSKLESLCRELQRHNKAVVEESKQRAREEEERRKEVSAKFQTTINEITVKMQEHHQRNQALREENAELVGKLKQLSEQYDSREEDFERVLKRKQLELQLCEVKMTQQSVTAAEEKETSMAERQYLLTETLEQQKRCEQLVHQEAELRGQLSMYSDKFEEFQKTLTKSNEVFSTFKKEMDRMSKTITSLEKEIVMWKGRYEKCNRSLLEMAEERLTHERAVATLRGKCERLEKLCRAMQSERSELNKKLKEREGPQSSSGGSDDLPLRGPTESRREGEGKEEEEGEEGGREQESQSDLQLTADSSVVEGDGPQPLPEDS